MENSTNVTNLETIAFPVFRLGLEKPTILMGVVSYLRLYHATEDKEEECRIRLVDDTSLSGTTLSRRRLQAKELGYDLYKISSAIFFLGDLIKLSAKGVWFIDSNGKVFHYIKKTRAKLKYYKLGRLIPISAGGAIVEVEGLPNRFKILYYPSVIPAYVGVLHWGMSTVLYGLYNEKYDESWRMV